MSTCEFCGSEDGAGECCTQHDRSTMYRTVTWEKGDAVYEGVQIRIKDEWKTVGFNYIGGIDDDDYDFRPQEITEDEFEDRIGDHKEAYLAMIARMKNGETGFNVRLDLEDYGTK